MRIFGFDITRVPEKTGRSELWNRSTYYENGRQIAQMAPDELRRELRWVRDQVIANGGAVILRIPAADPYQRIRAYATNAFTPYVPNPNP